MLDNDCNEEASDHDQDQFDDSAAGEHDCSTTSDESSSSDGDPLASVTVAEEPALEPSVEVDVHSVAAQLVRVFESFGKSTVKLGLTTGALQCTSTPTRFFRSSDLPW